MKMLSPELGPPATPLPVRWWRGLKRKRIARVVRIESRGAPYVMPALHDKGYVRLYLGRQHPYADKGGTCSLHRWLLQRAEGRRFESWEHVHHTNGDKATLDVEQLECLEAVEHGQWHFDRHFTRDKTGRLVWKSCGFEATSQELLEMAARHEEQES